jgi:DNA-directed RNA polymerase subunit RPC12/RpoP
MDAVDQNGDPADEEQEKPGLECPDCGCKHLPVHKTRDGPGKLRTRVRYCRNCGRRVLTRERQD